MYDLPNIPAKNDPIDQKLADYINTTYKNLDVRFTLKSPGVYEFGSRQILIKLERNRLKVKVGGGFLSIEDFVEQYAPIEQGRLERKASQGRIVPLEESSFAQITPKRSAYQSVSISPTKPEISLSQSQATLPQQILSPRA